MYFDELDLNDNVLDALYDMRFETCTPIQEKCIPEILEGKDVLGIAQTGTGKTAAYLLPILSRLADGGFPEDANNCVIMAPTRELAQQIDQAMQGFSYYLNGVSSIAIYGGNDGNRYDQELKSLSMGADVIIATPGRLISHMTMGNVDFSKVSFFILDEADRMLDMGFSEDILKIAKQLPATCQTVMFSATMPDKIEDLAKTLLKTPTIVKLAVSKPAEKIKQQAYVCYDTQKLEILKHLFQQGDLKRVIIFSGKKQKVKQIQHALQRLRINSGEMHSDLDQAQRDEMMYQFKSGQIDVLVATDIVSRGIDIDDIAMVINFDVPRDAEDYVHRIGRTARADRDGRAITLVSPDDIRYFKEIEKFLEKNVEKVPLPEEMGEAPEYKTASRPAKKTRRDDRNRNAHRRKPRHNDKPQAETNKDNQPKQGKSDKNKSNDNRQKNNGAKNDNKNKNNKRNDENKDRRNSENKNSEPRKQYNNRRKGQRGDKSQGVQDSYKAKRHNVAKQTQSSKENNPKKATGIKKILQKPLKWLRSKF